MYDRIPQAFGVLLLGLCLGCATDNVAGSAAVSAEASHGHDHAAPSTDRLHANHTNHTVSHGNHGQGKFVLETDADPAFYANRLNEALREQ